MENREFQKRALDSFIRLEEGQIELKEGYAKFNDKIDFVHHDLNTKIEMIANAAKQSVEKLDALVEKMLTKEQYVRRFRDLEIR